MSWLAPARFLPPPHSTGFPVMQGDGFVFERGGQLVLAATVVRLTSWWLIPGSALLLLLIAPGVIAFRDFPVWGPLAGALALVAVDLYRRRFGRAWELVVPRRPSFRVDADGLEARVTIALDRFVVGDARRPPVVVFTLAREHLAHLEALLS